MQEAMQLLYGYQKALIILPFLTPALPVLQRYPSAGSITLIKFALVNLKTAKMNATIRMLSIAVMVISGIVSGGFSKCQAQSTAVKADDILGKWTNEDKTRSIEFVKNGTAYDAIIREAPDKNLIGKKQITGLKYDGEMYKNGTVYLPKKRKSLACTAKLKRSSELELSANYSFISKSQIWTRVK